MKKTSKQYIEEAQQQLFVEEQQRKGSSTVPVKITYNKATGLIIASTDNTQFSCQVPKLFADELREILSYGMIKTTATFRN